MAKLSIASDWLQLYDYSISSVTSIQSEFLEKERSTGTQSVRLMSGLRTKVDTLGSDIEMLTKRLIEMEKKPSDYKLDDKEINKRKNKLNDLKVSYERFKKLLLGDGNAARRYIAGEDDKKRRVAVENERTVNMESDQLLLQQQQVLAAQDEHLDGILHGVGRLKAIGTDIGTELDLHSSLLNDLDHGMDKTTGKLKTNTKNAIVLQEESSSGWCGICTIVILIGIIILLAATNYACYVFNKDKCT